MRCRTPTPSSMRSAANVCAYCDSSKAISHPNSCSPPSRPCFNQFRIAGSLDVFSPDAEAPYRLEFLGDEIESIRQFSPETQRSLGDVQAIEITAQGHHAASEEMLRGHLCDYLAPQKTWTMLVEMGDLQEQGKYYLERVPGVRGLVSIPAVFQQLVQFPSIRLSALPSASAETTYHLRVESVERFSAGAWQ